MMSKAKVADISQLAYQERDVSKLFNTSLDESSPTKSKNGKKLLDPESDEDEDDQEEDALE